MNMSIMRIFRKSFISCICVSMPRQVLYIFKWNTKWIFTKFHYLNVFQFLTTLYCNRLHHSFGIHSQIIWDEAGKVCNKTIHYKIILPPTDCIFNLSKITNNKKFSSHSLCGEIQQEY